MAGSTPCNNSEQVLPKGYQSQKKKDDAGQVKNHSSPPAPGQHSTDRRDSGSSWGLGVPPPIRSMPRDRGKGGSCDRSLRCGQRLGLPPGVAGGPSDHRLAI